MGVQKDGLLHRLTFFEGMPGSELTDRWQFRLLLQFRVVRINTWIYAYTLSPHSFQWMCIYKGRLASFSGLLGTEKLFQVAKLCTTRGALECRPIAGTRLFKNIQECFSRNLPILKGLYHSFFILPSKTFNNVGIIWFISCFFYFVMSL